MAKSRYAKRWWWKLASGGAYVDFSWEADTGPLDIDFTDLTVEDPNNPATGWDWDFGDTNTSTDQNPTNVYAGHDTYQVTLTVTFDDLSTVVKSKAVNTEPLSVGGGWVWEDGSNAVWEDTSNAVWE